MTATHTESVHATRNLHHEVRNALLRQPQTSLTMRHRLTPAITCSTTTRPLETMLLRNWSAALRALPCGFFGAVWTAHPLAPTHESRSLYRASGFLMAAEGL